MSKNRVPQIAPELIKSFLEVIKSNMKIKEKNIPMTADEIALLPLGFTETSVFPTKSRSNEGSRYIKPTAWSHLHQPWFMQVNLNSLINNLGLINEKDLEESA